VVVYTGDTAQDVLDIIKSDIYAESGVWDLEKAQIIPVSPRPTGAKSMKVTDKDLNSMFLRFVNRSHSRIGGEERVERSWKWIFMKLFIYILHSRNGNESEAPATATCVTTLLLRPWPAAHIQ
jgi:hypothetical protein